MQKKFLNEILKSPQTVFSFQELLVKFNIYSTNKLKAKLHYYVKKGELHYIRRMFYSKQRSTL